MNTQNDWKKIFKEQNKNNRRRRVFKQDAFTQDWLNMLHKVFKFTICFCIAIMIIQL
jgi:hypothetical protein